MRRQLYLGRAFISLDGNHEDPAVIMRIQNDTELPTEQGVRNAFRSLCHRGYGFRLPGGVHTADGFWQLLSERGFVREPVASRYGRGYEPVLGEPGPSRLGAAYEGLMRGDEPYLFDCRLFGMSAREASVMDPQIRCS